MENKNKNTTADFHAVDFMRQVRSELTEQFLHDKQKYFEYLKQVMENFKIRQQKYNSL
ncbi:MAG: hypothetical protein FD181_1325 [Prolixibacteraceae bacterium]|nr:MAG: hypothetical protein FD181_1325 [Prolixibacteraceae bacterium]